MKRREAIGKTACMMPTIWAIPGIITFLQSCVQDKPAFEHLLVLNNTEFQLVSMLADTILPTTESPSASEVKVPEFIDLLLQDVFDQPTRNSFLTGLKKFDEDCMQTQGHSFVKLASEAQTKYLKDVDDQVMSVTYDQAAPFYFTFKQLVIKIYYSTEQGVKANLNYQPVPGPFQADVDLNPGDKILLGNDM